MDRTAALRPLARDLIIASAIAFAAWSILAYVPLRPLPPFGPAPGIALVALLWYGRRALPAIAVGILVGRLAIGIPWPIALGSSGAFLLQAMLNVWLLRRVAGFRTELDRPRDVAALAIVGFATGLVRASIEMPAAMPLLHLPPMTWPELLLLNGLGHSLSVLLFAPPLLALRPRPRLPRLSANVLEMLAALALIVATAAWCFLDVHHSGRLQVFGLVILPAAAWVALRGPRLAALSVPAVVALMAEWGAAHGRGLFAVGSELAVLRGLQAMSVAIGFATILLAAVENGRRRVLTDLLDREGRLRASQELFENFMRFSPVVAYIKDADGRLRYVNPAFEQQMWGGSPPNWRGRTGHQLFPADMMEAIRANDRQVLESGQPLTVEEVTRVHDQERTWLSIKFPLQSDRGETLLGGVSVDLSERRQAEEQRRALEARMMAAQKLESLGLLAGGIAHDFNNILTSILGYADLAREELPPDAPARDSLEHIVSGARSAADLTRQMLAYTGHGRVATHPLALASLVAEMGHLVQVSISKRCTLRYEFAPDVPLIDADEAQLRQVIMNLILNAAEALGERGGEITVRVFAREVSERDFDARWSSPHAQSGEHVVLEVRDEGAGMDEATLARIFDPFFTTKFTGRGLGLAAVLGIVRSHGGAVQVQSAPACGTTFRVLLPALPDATLVVPAPGPRATSDWRGSGRALVIDDEEAVRMLAATMLARLGFEVTTAVDGRDGLARFRERPTEYRLVLLDRTMPDLDGEAVLRAIRAERPEACVLLSSGYGGPDPGASRAELASGFIAKPYRLEELARAVRAALETVTA